MPARFVTLMNPRPRRRSRVSRGTGGRFVSRRRRTRRSISHYNPSPVRRIRRRRRSYRMHRNPPKMTSAMRRKVSLGVRRANARRRSPLRRMTALVPFRRRSAARRSGGGFSGGGLMSSFRSALGKPMLMKAGGAVVASIGTGYLMNRFASKLPLANNPYGRSLYLLGIPVAAAYLLRNKNRDLAEGLVIGGLVMTINNLMQAFKIGQAAAAGGTVASYAVAGELGQPRAFAAYPQSMRPSKAGTALGGSNVAFPPSAW